MTTLEPPSLSTNGLGAPTATVELPPDPRINEALGLQHRLETAIADLVDNSIDAGARNVWIRLVVNDAYVREILIADDGRGMSRGAIKNAFVLGGRQDYENGRLGHYGVGMKASAFSQAEQITVISRAADDHAVAMTARRSAAEAITADVYSQADAAAALTAPDVPIQGETGTLLRLSGIRTASASDRRDVRTQWIDDRIRLVREHLGLTFHRFLASGRLALTIDQWDLEHQESGIPFHPAAIDPLGVDTGKLGYPRPMLADLPGGASISLTCHLLAPGVKNAQARIFGRPRSDWQGVYVYRNDRLLNPGGWGDLTRAGAELQLARVAIDVTPATEKWFGMNAEKDGVLLLPDLVHGIQNAGDEDVSFRDYLDDARDVLSQSNRRDRSVKPLAPMGSGLPRAVEDLAGEHLGFREFERSVNVRWQSLRPDRLFLVEHDRATIWLNERHRNLLATGASDDPHGLVKTLLFLLFEGNFKQTHLQKTTIEQIEAWQAMAAVALGVREFVGSAEPVSLDEEIAELEQLDLVAGPQPEFETVASTDALPDGPAEPHDEDETGDDTGVIAEVLGGEWAADGMRDYLASVGRHTVLTAEEEVDLARRIEAGLLAAEARAQLHPEELRRRDARELSWIEHDGKRAMEKMVSSNLRLVVSIAKRYQNRGLELLDLIQEGNAGLVHAVEKFDYTRGLKFSTYATWWIRQAVTRAIANEGSTIRLPVHMVEFGSSVRGARAELRRELDRTPTSAEIAVRLGDDVKKVDLFLAMSRPLRSLNKSVADGDWEDLDDLAADEFGAPKLDVYEFGDTLVDATDPIESAIAAMMLRTQIDAVLEALDPREAGILAMRFGLGGEDPMTLDAIGDVYGVTRERIRQIEKKAFARLRQPGVLQKIAGENVTANQPGAEEPRPPAVSESEAADALADELIDLMDAFESLTPDDADAVQNRDSAERIWSAAELLSVLQTYRETRHVRSTAQIVSVEERDAAIALARLLLWREGAIDDFVNASQHGAPWTPDASDELLDAFTGGMELHELAQRFGRTQLAVAWRLMDSTAQAVEMPGDLFDLDRLERFWTEVVERSALWGQDEHRGTKSSGTADVMAPAVETPAGIESVPDAPSGAIPTVDIERIWLRGDPYTLGADGNIAARAGGPSLAESVGNRVADSVRARWQAARPGGGRFKVDRSGIVVTMVDGELTYVMRLVEHEWFPGYLI